MTELNIAELTNKFPLLEQLIALQEVSWFNPNITTLEQGLPYVGLSEEDIQDASLRLQRFAPYLAQAFPETQVTNGIIESELIEIPAMKSVLEDHYQSSIKGRLMMKKDSHLPISGSIKARGGIYEVLTHAEKLAFEAGLLGESAVSYTHLTLPTT